MVGLFCGLHAGSEQEFKEYTRKRIYYNAVIVFAGIALFIIASITREHWALMMGENFQFYYYGGGTGLILGGVINIVRAVMLLKDPVQLNENWMKCADHSNQKIAQKAGNIALTIMMIAIFLVIFIGGIDHPEIVKPLAFIVVLFTFSYTASYRFMQKRM